MTKAYSINAFHAHALAVLQPGIIALKTLMIKFQDVGVETVI